MARDGMRFQDESGIADLPARALDSEAHRVGLRVLLGDASREDMAFLAELDSSGARRAVTAPRDFRGIHRERDGLTSAPGCGPKAGTR